MTQFLHTRDGKTVTPPITDGLLNWSKEGAWKPPIIESEGPDRGARARVDLRIPSWRSSCCPVGEPGTRDPPCRGRRQWALWAAASDSAPGGHTNFIYFLPDPAAETSHSGAQGLFFVRLFMHDGPRKPPTRNAFPRLHAIPVRRGCLEWH